MTKFIVLVTLILMSTLSVAEKTIIMPIIAGTSQKDGGGVYDKVIRHITKQAGVNVNYVYYPLARAIETFAGDTNACWPFADKEIAEVFLEMPFVDSGIYFNHSFTGFVTRKSDPEITDLAQLKGKNVGLLTGDDPSAFGINLDDYKFHAVPSHEHNIKKLEAGRIDAIFGTATDLFVFSGNLSFSDSSKVYLQPETFVCHPGPESDAFIARVTPVIEAGIADGTFKSMLGKLYFDNE